MNDRTALIEAIVATGALRFGEFELAHGGTSTYYVDKYLFETDPAALELIAALFADLVGERTIAGVALGAVPLVTATSLHTGNPYVIVRKSSKDYGTAKQIEGEFEPGTEVVVIEDVATTGTSALDAVEALRAAGAEVSELLVVVDREEGASERLATADIRLRSLLSASDLLEYAESHDLVDTTE